MRRALFRLFIFGSYAGMCICFDMINHPVYWIGLICLTVACLNEVFD